MNISFEGKRILITGAGRGIGRVLALRLSNFEGKVIAISEIQKDLDTLFQEDPYIHLKAVINVSQIAAKNMTDSGKGGSIVNVSSQASQATLQDHTAYCSTKAGLDGLTRSMALELGPYDIRVNTVNPTIVLTKMGRLAWKSPEKSGDMTRKIPLGRFDEVDEILDVIVYLLSDKSSMINGVALPVNGDFLTYT